MVECHDIIPGSQRWHALRATVLTASDVGAAAGVDKYKTPLALWAEKTGLMPPGFENKMMRRGRWFEAAILNAIREENPDWDVDQPRVFLRDPQRRLGATPDAVAVTREPGITNIQMKLVAAPEFARSWSGGPPLSYQLQTACESMLMDAERGLLAALVIDAYNADLHLFPVPRHAAVEARIETIAAAFWDAIDNNRQPQPLFDRDAETVAAIYPTAVPGSVVDLSGDNRLPGRLMEREELKEVIKGAETRIAEIDTEIKAKLGDAEMAELNGWRLTHKSQHRNAYMVPEKDYRVLRITHLEEQPA